MKKKSQLPDKASVCCGAARHVGGLAKTCTRLCSALQLLLALQGLKQSKPGLLEKHYSRKKELQMIFLGKSSSLEQ